MLAAREDWQALCRPIFTLSSTESLENRRIFWKVRAIPSWLSCQVFFPAGVYAVYQYDAVGWLVNVGQQVKYGGLARTVRAYKAGYLGAAQHYTEILNCVQTAEVYPKAVYLKYGF